MLHLPNLITDLALILCAAGVTTLIFKKLKQPVVLGYILAGFLVGPYFHLFPTITEIENVTVWAEIGVIFLLFSLGLEFSFKKLAKVGAPASVTAMVEVISMIFIGYATGMMLGWNTIDSIFLGGILSISSTTIIIRAFDELEIKTQKFAGLVMGVLIVEDLVAIVLLVLLSTFGISQQFAGKEIIFSVLKLVFFLALWFVAGIFLLPGILKKIKPLLNDETLLVVSLALCFLMVFLASEAGFSPALGAFIMGSLLAETTKAEKIEHLVQPVKNFFAAVFFVSVGMLIDPSILVEYAVPVLVISLVTIVGQSTSSALGALISGQPLKMAIQTGLSLTQIGEFSFIIATLGLTLKVTSPFLYPIAVAVSAITTFTTPYLIRFSPVVHAKIEAMLPEKWILNINRYSSGTQKVTKESDWKKVLQTYGTVIIINSVILIAIILVSERYLAPAIKNVMSGNWAAVVTALLALSFMAPFLWALGVKKLSGSSYTSLWLNKTYNRGPLVLLELFRLALIIFFTGMLLNRLFSARVAMAVAVPGIIVGLVVFSKRLQHFYSRLERRFLTNLNIRGKNSSQHHGDDLLPWDLHMAGFEVSPHSVAVGKPLHELRFRERFGVNIALIKRGEMILNVPKRNDCLYPFDHIDVIGTDANLDRFKQELDVRVPEATANVLEVSLYQFTVDPGSALHDKTIRESGFREKINGIIVGIERQGERISNPESTERIQVSDIVWVVGSKMRRKPE